MITFGDGSATHLFFQTKVTEGKWEVTTDISPLQSGSLMLMGEVADLAGNPAAFQRQGVMLDKRSNKFLKPVSFPYRSQGAGSFGRRGK